jgi:hypothetical protein
VDIASTKSAQLSKNTIPHAFASMAVMRITLDAPGPKNVSCASGSKAGGGGLGSKIVVSVKKDITSIRKCIVLAIGVLAEISWEGTHESSPHGLAFRALAPKVQSRVEPHGQSSEPCGRSPRASVLGSNPKASLHIVAPLGAGRVSTGCLRLCVHLFVLPNDILTFVAACFGCL